MLDDQHEYTNARHTDDGDEEFIVVFEDRRPAPEFAGGIPPMNDGENVYFPSKWLDVLLKEHVALSVLGEFMTFGEGYEVDIDDLHPHPETTREELVEAVRRLGELGYLVDRRVRPFTAEDFQ